MNAEILRVLDEENGPDWHRLYVFTEGELEGTEYYVYRNKNTGLLRLIERSFGTCEGCDYYHACDTDAMRASYLRGHIGNATHFENWEKVLDHVSGMPYAHPDFKADMHKVPF